MSQSESDIGCSYSFKSIKSRLDCLEKDTARLKVETDKIKVERDLPFFRQTTTKMILHESNTNIDL